MVTVDLRKEDGGVVVKRATGEAERARLAGEAEVLATAAHPGVVRLLAADPAGELRLAAVDGDDLRSVEQLPAEVVAGLGAAVATTLSDLHALGVVHRGIEPAHVLVDPDGRPVLCGFGRAGRDRSGAAPGEDARRDVADLARMLLSLLPAAARPRLRRTLRRAAADGRRPGRTDAAGLARRLVRCEPGARLPARAGAEAGVEAGAARPARPAGPEGDAGGAGRRRRVPARAVVAAVTLVGLAAAAWWGSAAAGRPRAAARPAARPAAPAPGRDPVVVARGFRWSVGAPGDVVALGRWGCAARPVPAVLRPSTGQVWVWRGWATAGHPRPGRLVARVPGATGLAPGPLRPGCDELVVRRATGPSVTLEPGSGR